MVFFGAGYVRVIHRVKAGAFATPPKKNMFLVGGFKIWKNYRANVFVEMQHFGDVGSLVVQAKDDLLFAGHYLAKKNRDIGK